MNSQSQTSDIFISDTFDPSVYEPLFHDPELLRLFLDDLTTPSSPSTSDSDISSSSFEHLDSDFWFDPAPGSPADSAMFEFTTLLDASPFLKAEPIGSPTLTDGSFESSSPASTLDTGSDSSSAEEPDVAVRRCIKKSRTAKFLCDWDGCSKWILVKNKKQHERTHNSDKRFACKYAHAGCTKFYTRPNDMVRHVNTVHNPRDKLKLPTGNKRRRADCDACRKPIKGGVCGCGFTVISNEPEILYPTGLFPNTQL